MMVKSKKFGTKEPKQQNRNKEKNPKSSNPSSSVVPLKVEAKVDIPTFGGEVEAKKLNNQLK